MKRKVVNQISLQERLDRLAEGKSSDEEYSISLIRSMAGMRIYDYLQGYPSEWNWLMALMRVPFEEGKKLTYAEAAVRLQAMYQDNSSTMMRKFDDAVDILVRPVLDYYELKRRGYYAK